MTLRPEDAALVAELKAADGGWGAKAGTLKAAYEAIERLARESWELQEALTETLRKYEQLADSGDCGFWDCSTEAHVIEAHRLLAPRLAGEAKT